MAVLGELARTHRRQRDPVLVGLDLGWNADLHARTSSRVVISKVQPRRSSSANISAGSMQRSGGTAPRASMLPRASSRTAAAAGAAVETTPPPRPQASLRLGERPNPHRPSAAVRLHQMHGQRPAQRAGQLHRRSAGSPPPGPAVSSRRVDSRSGDRESLKLACAATEAVAEGAQLGVQGVNRLGRPDRLAELDHPAGGERVDLLRRPVAEHHRPHGQLVEQRLERVGDAEAGRGVEVAAGR